MTDATLRVALIGFGRMGRQHAKVYAQGKEFELAAICGRDHQRDEVVATYARTNFYTDYSAMLMETGPDLVCISTHVDTHDQYARMAIAQGCHVFLEKPATTRAETSRQLFEHAMQHDLKLVVGYILQHNPLWNAFIDECRTLDGPIEISCHLDQHSEGDEWQTHRKILKDSSIAFDCAIHFYDVFCRAIDAQPVSFEAESGNTHGDSSLHDNFLSSRIQFANGSSGHYQSAWGPGFDSPPITSIRATGQKACVSIVDGRIVRSVEDCADSVIYSNAGNEMAALQGQQQFSYDVITKNISLTEHHERALQSMRLAEAVDRCSGQG